MKHFSAEEMLLLRWRIPNPRHLQGLELAYFLSLHTEEGSAIRAALLLSGERRTFPGEKLLGQPVRADIPSLRKFVAATDSAATAIHLTSEVPEAPLMIVGICPRPPAPANIGGTEDILLIEVTGPGQVALVNVLDRIEYDRGEVRTPRDLELAGAFLEPVVRHLTTPTPMGNALHLGHSVVVFDPTAWTKHRKEFEDSVRQRTVETVPSWVRVLLEKVEARQKGGAILLTTEGCSWRDKTILCHELRPAPTAPTTPMPWNSGLLDLLGWSGHLNLASETGVLVLADVVMKPADWINGPGAGRVDAAVSMAIDDASRCAKLCEMDGAVVFSPMLEPCAMGATFALGEVATEFSGQLKGRGHRHRSMAAVVSGSPGSMGFVVSMDGGCSFFQHLADGSKAAGRL